MTPLLFRPARLASLALGLGLAWACTVADKGDYTFTDTPGTGGTGGASGGAGGKGGKGGNGGTAGRSAGGSAGSMIGGAAGEGGQAGATGGEAGETGAGAGGTGGSTGDPCTPNPCVHGSCDVDGSDYNCDCDTGWEGSRCQTNTDDCDPNPCQFGGTCTDALNDYSCTCAPGYSGDTCEIAPEDCDPDPCVNGNCTEVSGGISCTCDAGWSGDNCTTNIDECAPAPCQNGGTCRDQVNGYLCDCTNTGYGGTNCETAINECDPNPCHMGTCTDLVNDYRCSCPAGTLGDDCERYCGNNSIDGAEVTSIRLTYVMIHCSTMTEAPLFLNGVKVHGLGMGTCSCYDTTERTAVITDPAVLAAVRPTGNVFEVRQGTEGAVYTGIVRAEISLTGAANVTVTAIDGTAGAICESYPPYYYYPSEVTAGTIAGPAFNVLGAEACDGQSGCTACGCPNESIVCGDTCTNINTNSNCGQCGRSCNSNQQCVAGVCKTYQWRLLTGTACNAWCGSAASPFNVCVPSGQTFSCNSTFLGGYIYVYGDATPTNPIPAGFSAGQAYGWVHRWCDQNGCGGIADPGGQTCNTSGTGDVHQCVLE